jgi:hypothetical protein
MLEAGTGSMGRRERLVAGNGALLEGCSFCETGRARGSVPAGRELGISAITGSEKAIGQLAT